MKKLFASDAFEECINQIIERSKNNRGGKNMKKLLASERAAAIRLLKENVKEGDTLYTIVTKVNVLNSARWMRVLDIKDGSPSHWNYYVSKALGYKLKDDGTIYVKGGGMDMGFHVVSTLSRVLYGSENKIKHRWL